MPRGDEHRVVVRYGIDGSAGGLINQMLCHIGAFMLAVSLRAEIELPNALSRSAYNVSFWQQKWHVEPLTTLLDVDRIVMYWQRQGIAVHKNLSDASPLPPLKMQIRGQNRDLATVVAEAKEDIARHNLQNPASACTIIDLGVINSEHFPFNVTGYQNLTTQIIKSLQFAPTVKILAREVLLKISQSGPRLFNGLHLRFEADGLSAWAFDDRAKQELWEAYVAGMREAKFSASQDVYIASGLLSYNDNKEFSQISARLQEQGLCRRVLHKEMYLSSRILAGLHSEQKALVDLLVLAQAHKYVGSLRSSYSCFARDIRTLRHKERDSTVIIRVGDFPASVLPFQELAVA